MHGIRNATFVSKQLKEKPCIDRRMILKGALRRKIVNWICVVQDKWPAAAKTVDHRVP